MGSLHARPAPRVTMCQRHPDSLQQGPPRPSALCRAPVPHSPPQCWGAPLWLFSSPQFSPGAAEVGGFPGALPLGPAQRQGVRPPHPHKHRPLESSGTPCPGHLGRRLRCSPSPDFIDIVKDPVPPSEYKTDEDPRLFRSVKTQRGPLPDNWVEESRRCLLPLMCAYKLCKVEFRYWGMQSKIERFIHDTGERRPRPAHSPSGGGRDTAATLEAGRPWDPEEQRWVPDHGRWPLAQERGWLRPPRVGRERSRDPQRQACLRDAGEVASKHVSTTHAWGHVTLKPPSRRVQRRPRTWCRQW